MIVNKLTAKNYLHNMSNKNYPEEDFQNSMAEQQIVIPRSYQEDIIQELYKVHLSNPINELSNELCKYYYATDLSNQQEYFAIVFEREFNPDIKTWHLLQSLNIKGLNNLIAYGITRLSSLKTPRLVAIVEKYDIANNLEQFIQTTGILSETAIKTLVRNIIDVLKQCEKMQIACGNINPANILVINNGEGFILREFISSYTNFHQHPYYLAPELAECIPIGRQVNGVAADIFALGVTAFYSTTGKAVDTKYEKIEEFNKERLEHSTYKLLVSKSKISEYFKVFFKGSMNDDPSLRWKIHNIEEWLAGTLAKGVQLFDSISENNNLLAFNGHNYGNLKSLAYAFFSSWDEATYFIQDDKLIRWAKRHQINNYTLEQIQQVIGDIKPLPDAIKIRDRKYDAKLIRLLMIMDPQGSIRQKDLALSASSIPKTLYYFIEKNKGIILDKVIKILQEKYWQNAVDKNSANWIDSSTIVKLENITKLFSPTSLTCGIERIAYSFNPTAICLSPILSNEYILTLADLMMALDKIAEQKRSQFNIDRHIIAFIAAKINFLAEQEEHIKILKNFPKLAEHPIIFGLCVLNLAQQQQPNIKITNLCVAITHKIIELLDSFIHNKKFKQQISSQLMEASKTGNLSKILHILTDQTPFVKDYEGYYKAYNEMQKLKKNMNLLNLKGKVTEHSLFLGQRLTVLMSYVFCFIITVILIMQ